MKEPCQIKNLNPRTQTHYLTYIPNTIETKSNPDGEPFTLQFLEKAARSKFGRAYNAMEKILRVSARINQTDPEGDDVDGHWVLAHEELVEIPINI